MFYTIIITKRKLRNLQSIYIKLLSMLDNKVTDEGWRLSVPIGHHLVRPINYYRILNSEACIIMQQIKSVKPLPEIPDYFMMVISSSCCTISNLALCLYVWQNSGKWARGFGSSYPRRNKDEVSGFWYQSAMYSHLGSKPADRKSFSVILLLFVIQYYT